MHKMLIESLKAKEAILLADIELLQDRLAVATEEYHSVVNILRVNGVNAPLLRYCANTQCQRGFASARQTQIYCSNECRISAYAEQCYGAKRKLERGRRWRGNQ